MLKRTIFQQWQQILCNVQQDGHYPGNPELESTPRVRFPPRKEGRRDFCSVFGIIPGNFLAVGSSRNKK